MALEETTLRIDALSKMPGVITDSEADMKRREATETWRTKL